MAYTGEWERYVNEVTLLGRPDLLRASAREWETALRRVTGTADMLARLATRSGSWTGGGANAFRGHVMALRAAAEKTVAEHHRVRIALDACADELTTAMRDIFVPSWLRPEIIARQSRAVREGVHTPFAPGEFERRLRERTERLNPHAAPELKARWDTEIRLALDEGEDVSRIAYERLRAAYGRLVGEMPGGTPVDVPHVKGDAAKTAANKAAHTAANTAAANPAAANPAANTAGVGAAGTTPSTPLPGTDIGPDTGSGTDTGTGFTPPDLDPGTGFEPFEPGTGLAGAGDLAGAGFGSAGGGGVSAGGGRLPIGDAVATPAAAMTAVAKRGSAGAGVVPGSGGATPKTATMMPGMMGAGGAAGLANNQAAQGTRTTALVESDPLFAVDDGVPSGVIDA
ncbi:hypothetical protein GCM10009557_49800 [Virgisporangium ochraceum]|uniref:PPE family domain-containing protein n=1 Tax=Virgisporangium ochraceum TaxID=65505 RepID=A0A8J4EAZ5_9ACTN|nr:hypothetical protein [Virgisporangium ochraceum]GIJ68186.1 hypothetical protein Voc01_031030 [Virgisporangium ochraceum]